MAPPQKIVGDASSSSSSNNNNNKNDDNNNNNNKSTNVQVAIRCRPLNTEEIKKNMLPILSCDTDRKQVKVNYGSGSKKISKTYQYDKVFGRYASQEDIFKGIVSNIVDEMMTGFNCTIFAYGQTGTGKTHTMEGSLHDKSQSGIIPRSVDRIFEKLESMDADYSVRVSYLELYNEELMDLLSGNDNHNNNNHINNNNNNNDNSKDIMTMSKSSKDKSKDNNKDKLRLFEDPKKGPTVVGLEEIAVVNADDIMKIVSKGVQKRQTAATLCNKNSSRSHSIFTLKIMIKETTPEGEDVVRNGQLNLVDLAGSECVGRSGAKNERAREAGNINQSLLTLGRVITALVEHHQHIPYRDSKLTRLLQESLGGRAKTCIIATLAPGLSNIDETLSTLDYAFRAKNIENRPQVNQRMTSKAVIKEYSAEVDNLKAQLQAQREKNGVYLDPMKFDEMQEMLSQQKSQLKEAEQEITSRQSKVDELMISFTELNGKVKDVEDELHVSKKNLIKANTRNDDLTMILKETTNKLNESLIELHQSKMECDSLDAILYTTTGDLHASKTLVKDLYSTEMNLTNEASEIKNSLNASTLDITGLFNKIQRLIIHSSEKITLSQQMYKDISEFIMKLNNESNDVTMHSNKMGELLNKEISNFNNSFSLFVNNAITSYITSLTKGMATGKQITIDKIMADCEILKEKVLNEFITNNGAFSEKLSLEINQLEINVGKNNNELLEKFLTHEYKDIEKEASEIQNILHMEMMTLKEYFIKYEKENQEFKKQLSNSQLEKEIKIQSSIESSEEVITHQNEYIEKAITNMTTELEYFKKMLLSKNSNYLETMKTENMKFSESCSNEYNNTHKYLDDSMENMKETNTSTIQLLDMVKSKTQANVESMKLVKGTVEEITASNVSMIQSHHETSKVLLTDLDKNTKITIGTGNTVVENLTKSANEMLEIVSDGIRNGEEMGKNVVSGCEESMGNLAEKTSTVIEETLGEIGHVMTSHKETLVLTETTVSNFTDKLSEEYVVTNTTPNKREFPCPEKFSATLPEAEILKKSLAKFFQDQVPPIKRVSENGNVDVDTTNNLQIEVDTTNNLPDNDNNDNDMEQSPLSPVGEVHFDNTNNITNVMEVTTADDQAKIDMNVIEVTSTTTSTTNNNKSVEQENGKENGKENEKEVPEPEPECPGSAKKRSRGGMETSNIPTTRKKTKATSSTKIPKSKISTRRRAAAAAPLQEITDTEK